MRVSVTLLDSFLYWKYGEFFTEDAERKSYNELVSRIKGERTPQTEAMVRSIAFHKICEKPALYVDGAVFECDGWVFDWKSTQEFIEKLPEDRVTEVKMVEEVRGHTLVGKADYLRGVCAGDYKLSKKVTPDKYADSIQWKAYCLLSGVKKFTYHVAQPRENRKTGVVSLHDAKEFTYYPTHATDHQVLSTIDEFAEFAEAIKCP